jgi:trehalose/maltose transport system permease protein
VLTSNSGSTISMSGFVRRDMVDNGNLGSGSAGATSLTLIIFIAALLFLRATRVKLNEESN